MENKVKKNILYILLKPSTVTEIKAQMPQVKSFGTIAYHLKKLEEEGVITKEKAEKKQGRPTTYKLISKEKRAFFKKLGGEDRERKKAYLKLIKENPFMPDSRMLDELEKMGYDDGLMGDSSMDAVGEKLSYLAHKITVKGEQYLKGAKQNHENKTKTKDLLA